MKQLHLVLSDDLGYPIPEAGKSGFQTGHVEIDACQVFQIL
jgi:hypothetical protein